MKRDDAPIRVRARSHCGGRTVAAVGWLLLAFAAQFAAANDSAAPPLLLRPCDTPFPGNPLEFRVAAAGAVDMAYEVDVRRGGPNGFPTKIAVDLSPLDDSAVAYLSPDPFASELRSPILKAMGSKWAWRARVKRLDANGAIEDTPWSAWCEFSLGRVTYGEAWFRIEGLNGTAVRASPPAPAAAPETPAAEDRAAPPPVKKSRRARRR